MPVKADPIAWGARSGADEVLEKRSRHSKHFRNPDGSFTAVIGQHLHYESTPGTWDDVDLNFRASGSDYIADKHEVNSRVSGAWLESWDRKTSKGVRWLSPAAFAVAGNTAKADGQGLTWRYTNRTSGLKIEATVSVKQGPKTYKFGYLMVGGARDWTVDAAGNLTSDGMSVPRAYVIGADGVKRDCTSWKLLAGPFVSFAFDDSALPPEAFPYTIDPTTTFGVALSADDGYVGVSGSSVYPPTGGSAAPATANNYIFPERSKVSTAYTVSVGLVRLDSSALPDTATVTAAKLQLTMTDQLLSTDARSVVVEWYAASNWPIDAADYTATAASTAHAGIALSSLVLNAANDFPLTTPTNVSLVGPTGFRLHVSGGQPTGYNYAGFASFDHATLAEPRLIIDYTDGAVPGPVTYTVTLSVVMTPSPTDTKKISKPLSTAVTTSNTVGRGVSRTLAIVASALNTLAKNVRSAQATAVTATTALVKTPQLARSASVTASTVASKAVAKAAALSVSVANTMAKAITTAKSATVTMATTATKTVKQTLTRAVTTTTTATRTTGKSLSAIVTSASTGTKLLAKAISVTVTATPLLAKTVSMSRAAISTITTALSWTVGRAYTMTLTAVVQVTPTVAKSIGKRLSAAVTGAGTLAKAVQTTRLVAVVSVTSTAKSVAKSLAAGVTVTTTLARSVGKSLLATVTALPSIAKGIQVRLTAAVAMTRSVSKGIAVSRAIAVQVVTVLISLVNRIGGHVLLFLRMTQLPPRLQVRELPQKWVVRALTLYTNYRVTETRELSIQITPDRKDVTLPTAGVTATWRLLQDTTLLSTGPAVVTYEASAITVTALVSFTEPNRCQLEYAVNGLGNEILKPILGLAISK